MFGLTSQGRLGNLDGRMSSMENRLETIITVLHKAEEKSERRMDKLFDIVEGLSTEVDDVRLVVAANAQAAKIAKWFLGLLVTTGLGAAVALWAPSAEAMYSKQEDYTTLLESANLKVLN